MAWGFLAAAIIAELFGTLGLRSVATHRVWWAVVLIAVAYTVSFVCMTISLRQLNIGVVYAIWSAVGTAAVSIAGLLLFGDRLNWQGIAGMCLIVGGVVVLVSSGTLRHS